MCEAREDWDGARSHLEAWLAIVDPLNENLKLRDYYLFLAVRGHLLLALGRPAEAAECFRAAIDRPCSAPERRFLARKLAGCHVSEPRA